MSKNPYVVWFMLGILLVLAILLGVSCGGSKKSTSAANGGLTKLTLQAKSGSKVTLNVEIADDEPEREKGLSSRTTLPQDNGMLFLLDDRHAGFWMKDTLIDLSVAFISQCGQIVFIDEMKANTFDIHNTPQPYRFGLEANPGWFKSHGLNLGDQVEIPTSLKQAGCT